ncbi:MULTISPECIES: hypothetical protein [Rhodococcus]|uniref:Uncharacterized protein n=1 Tax=Rhodococcus cerastii TaxID=908616 RepID=A0ABU4D1Y1_9NOCA|nr:MULTISPECIES: hypothetical protein [Rhodococcus]MDV6303726.1 hypothetical protein [Rhodococcus cerastii]MDV8058271.1 hypothetical protein [Rhodococcus sp. IEGM 1343]
MTDGDPAVIGWLASAAVNIWRSFTALLSRFATVEWIADVGLPLVVAGLGLWLAGRYFNGTLEADRKALNTQLEADRAARELERRHGFGLDYAATARRIADNLLEDCASFVRETDLGSVTTFIKSATRANVDLSAAAALLSSRLGSGPYVWAAYQIPNVSIAQAKVLQHHKLRLSGEDRAEVIGLRRLDVSLRTATVTIGAIHKLALELDKWDGGTQNPYRPTPFDYPLPTDTEERTHSAELSEHELSDYLENRCTEMADADAMFTPRTSGDTS